MTAAANLTIASGTPIQLCNALTSPTRLATRVIIQCQPAAGAGQIYVFRGVPIGVTPSTSTFPYITLAAGGATSPSDTFTDRLDTGDTSNIDLCGMWIDGSHTGDVVTFSPDIKV
jgi:hypothetical protein